MPEDSVRPETQTLIVLIRRKGFVGCFYNIYLKKALIYKNQLNQIIKIKARIKYRIKKCLEIGMVSIDTKWNTKGESFYLLMIDAEERR